MTEEELGGQTPAALRLAEAEYFLREYVRHCGPPRDWYFAMVCSFDAFLFSLVSVEEMVDEATKTELQAGSDFRFFKALRNITTHHSILAAPIAGKFERPFSRVITDGNIGEASSRLRLRFDVLRRIFDAVENERKNEAATLRVAREFVAELEAAGNRGFLEDIMEQALHSVKRVLGYIPNGKLQPTPGTGNQRG